MEFSDKSFPTPESPSLIGIRHLQAFLLFLMGAISYGMRSSLSVVIVAMTDRNSTNEDFHTFDWDTKQRNYIVSSLLWGVLITQPLVGYLIMNRGIKIFLWVGFIISGVASTLTPILAEKGGWLAFIFARFVIGLSQGCVTPSPSKILSSWAPPSERARLGSLVINGAQFGTVVFMPTTSVLLMSKFGWPGVFYLFGLICIGWAITFYFLGADTPAEHRMTSQQEIHYINSSLGNLNESADKQNQVFPWKLVLKSGPAWSLLIVTSGQSFCYYFLLSQLPTYMKYMLKFDVQESGLISALPYVAMWLLGFPISCLSDFALKKGIPISVVRKVCNSISMWVPSLALIALCTVKTDNVNIYVAIFIVGVGLNAGVSCGLEINGIDLTPNFCGTLVSITNTAGKICGMLSPIICGYIVTDTSDEKQWQTVFYLVASVYFVTNMIFVLFGSATRQPWDQHEKYPNDLQRRKTSTISVAYFGEIIMKENCQS